MFNPDSAEHKHAHQNEETMLMAEIAGLIKSLRQSIDQLNRSLPSVSSGSSSSLNPAAQRMHSTIYSSLVSRFVQLTRSFSDAVVQIKAQDQSVMERQLRIMNPASSDRDIEAAIAEASGHHVDQLNSGVFLQSVLRSVNDRGQQSAAMTMFLEAQEKNQDLLLIEQQLQELHNMFVDLNEMVLTQGEVIDSIETNISQAENYIEAGVSDLHESAKKKAKARKKKCKIFAIILVILIIIAATSTLGSAL
jgi:syntaxin 1B/2/3